MTTHDEAPPVIETLSRKIETLERRRDHLKARLDTPARSSTSTAYDLAEHAALVDAIRLMQWHQAQRGAS